jgi:hypothetical protein
MKPFAGVVALLMVAGAAGFTLPAQSPSEPVPTETNSGPAVITLPAGTRIELVLTAPVWSRSTGPGHPLYAQTDFPVVTGSRVAVPPGTFIEGAIESVLRPTRRSSRAEIEILFTKIVFANGYVIALPAAPRAGAPGTGSGASTGYPSPPPTAVTVTIEVSQANDLLLDNGAEIEMTLAAPVSLDAAQVANAIPKTRAPEPGKYKSASVCRPIPGSPGTPGTPDTVIPGSPGTPDVTIPGGPGMPGTTIPGTPATPPTVIPGSPGTPGFPGIACPPPPIVVSSVPLLIKPAQDQAATPQPNH